MKLKGIVVPIGTPLEQDERIDEGGLRRLTRYLLENGVHGILANGSMGGFAHLEDREQVRALEVILDEVGGKIPVVANVGENGTRRTLRKAKQFELLKPDYLAVLPPFYFPMGQRELRHFYEEIAGEVQTPIFLYNNPITTKCDLNFETIAALSEHPNLVGIKDSKQDVDKWLRMVRHFRGAGFSILVGTESLVSTALMLDCDGVIAGLHNICPQIAVHLYEAVLSDDRLLADRLQEKLNDFFSIVAEGEPWGAFEVALQYLGICQKVTSSPFCSITDPLRRKRIAEILKQHLPVSAFRLKTAEQE